MTRHHGSEASRLLSRIREFSELDLAAVTDMDDAARSHLADQRGGEAWLAEHPPIGTVLETQCRISVAVLADMVVGFCVTIDDVDALRGRICRIERVYVDERAREIGCGDALLVHEMRHAISRGCDFIEADALPGDRDTKNLYERAGITARRITVSRRLSDPSNQEPASR